MRGFVNSLVPGSGGGGGGDVFENAVRYNPSTTYLQYYNGTTWVNLFKFAATLKAYIVFARSLTTSTGSFSVYFMDVAYDENTGSVSYVNYNEADTWTQNTHTTHTFAATIQNNYGLQKLVYNANGAPYNTNLYSMSGYSVMHKVLTTSSADSVDTIISNTLPVQYDTLSILTTSGANISSVSGTTTNRIIDFGMIAPS